jgi:predicted Fe-Mo cluster-binding NifX family protein
MFTLATPALIAARLVDAGIGAVITRTRGSNAYRVLARKNVAVAAG